MTPYTSKEIGKNKSTRSRRKRRANNDINKTMINDNLYLYFDNYKTISVVMRSWNHNF